MSNAQFVGVPQNVIEGMRERISHIDTQQSAEEVIHLAHDALRDLHSIEWLGVMSRLQASIVRAEIVDRCMSRLVVGKLPLEMQ